MAEVEVRTIVSVATNEFRIGGSFPFAALDDQLSVRHVGIPANVVEMQMRVDHVVDSFRINLMGMQTSPQLFAGAIMHLEDFGEFPDSVGTGLQLPMQTRIEYDPALWML